MRAIYAALLVALLAATSAVATDEPKKNDPDAMLEAYVEAAKPVVEHARLSELAGPWNVTTRFWMDPGAEASVAAGTGRGAMILGGRFASVETEIKGSIDLQTLTILGFDRRTSEYTLVAYDTLGTYYVTAAGPYDAERRAVVMRGSYAQPPTGREQKYAFVWTTPSPKEHVMTLYFVIDGADVPIAETRFAR